jgi:hypothetical protein
MFPATAGSALSRIPLSRHCARFKEIDMNAAVETELDEGLIAEADFVDHWGAHGLPNGDLMWIEDIQGLPENTIWTIVESDDGESQVAARGIHHVNRLGFVVTTRPWDENTPDAWWFKD